MAARPLAAAGFRTAILEKKKVVGEPVQCAEGVSEFGLASNGLHPRDEWIAQRVSGAKCIVPNGTWFYITRLPGYAISRPVFDRWLVDGAVDDGAELRTSTKVTGISRHDGGWRIEANGETIESRILIGADGPASFVARQAGLVRNLERIGAYEYRFRREDVPLLDPEYFLLYIGEAYNGGYAWIFPKGDSVNVGAGGHIDAHAATVDFCRKFGIDVDRKTQTIAGSIPSRYDLTALAAPGLAIAGDAAGITNPLNGAGIHPGIFSGRVAGEFAVDALEQEDPNSMIGYDRAMKESPFLDPLLFWMIDRIRRWGDRLMNSVGEELDGLDWRAVNPRMILSVLLRKPWLGIHAREFYRMILALELCDRYGWELRFLRAIHRSLDSSSGIPARDARGGREPCDSRGQSSRADPRLGGVRGDRGDCPASVRGRLGDPPPRGRLSQDRGCVQRDRWPARARPDFLPGRRDDRLARGRRADHANGLARPKPHRPPIGSPRGRGPRNPQCPLPVGRPTARGKRERRESRLRPQHGGDDRDVPSAAGHRDLARRGQSRAGAQGVHRSGRGPVSRFEGGIVREASGKSHRGRGLRPDPGRLRRGRIRGVDALGAEGMAPRQGVHPRGCDPAKVREDGPVHGREAGSGRPEAHPGPNGPRPESEGGGREHRGADDQGTEENRGRPRGPHHADRVGRNRARSRAGGRPPSSPRSDAVRASPAARPS